MWDLLKTLLLPISFRRQYAQPLDYDAVFETLADMQTYLSNPVRYQGQVATCLETSKIYHLNTARDAWVEVSSVTNHSQLSNKNTETGFQHVDSVTEKTTPVDADKIAIWDSVAGKYVSIVWSTLITFLKGVFQPIDREIIAFRSDSSTDDYAIITREYAYYIASIPSGFSIKYTNGTSYVANTNVAADTNLYVYASVFPSKCKLTLSRQ